MDGPGRTRFGLVGSGFGSRRRRRKETRPGRERKGRKREKPKKPTEPLSTHSFTHSLLIWHRPIHPSTPRTTRPISRTTAPPPGKLFQDLSSWIFAGVRGLPPSGSFCWCLRPRPSPWKNWATTTSSPGWKTRTRHWSVGLQLLNKQGLSKFSNHFFFSTFFWTTMCRLGKIWGRRLSVQNVKAFCAYYNGALALP